MLKEKALSYYDADYNCAESILRGGNDAYGLGLDENALKVIAGFGGGMGCEGVCGALSGAIAVLSRLEVGERAHITEGFKDRCAGLVAAFEEKLGSTNCGEIKRTWFEADGCRCRKTVEAAAEVLEAYLKK